MESTREIIAGTLAFRLFITGFRVSLVGMAIAGLGGAVTATHKYRELYVSLAVGGVAVGVSGVVLVLGSSLRLKKMLGPQPDDPSGLGAWLLLSTFRPNHRQKR